jgi:hypothetical protein
MGHSAGVLKDKFCAQRKDKCKDGQKYRENCKVGWKYQAHHVLCVASVTQFLAKKRGIDKVIRQTKWCINTKENMLAMPLWGTLTKFYSGRMRLNDFTVRPGFANIPIHSYDHNSPKGYKKDIDKAMTSLANKVAASTENHKDTSDTLLSDLNSVRNATKRELRRRGRRGLGTHKEWLKGYAGDPSKKWYEPFSMAADGNAEPRTFPVRRTKAAAAKVAKLVKNLI